MDGVGCGVQNDYRMFHKEKGNTLKNVYKALPKFELPNLERLGLKKILFGEAAGHFIAGKMQENTLGNDTFAGVWEMFGVIFNKRFRTSKSGFSNNIIQKIESNLGVPAVGNEFISGYKVLDKYYKEHKVRRGPILYLADDGVVLLAAHEKIISPQKLNFFAKKLSDLLSNEKITRIITRPFIGNPGKFIRTVKNRKDIVVPNKFFSQSALPILEKGSINIGTTEHIYNILGKPGYIKYEKGNLDNYEQLKLILSKIKSVPKKELMVFCLEDFDLIGHEKDIKKYSLKLKEFDCFLPKILKALNQDDLLIITADHGCDPTIDMRGHTREYVPLMFYSKQLKNKRIWLGTREKFSDLGQSILHNYSLPRVKHGEIIHEIF